MSVASAALDRSIPPDSERRFPFFVVTFTRNDPPGTRGPDHDARVLVDAHTGKVTELHAAS